MNGLFLGLLVLLAVAWWLAGYLGSLHFMRRYLDLIYSQAGLSCLKPPLNAGDRTLAAMLGAAGLVTLAIWALMDRSDRRRVVR